MEICTTGPVSVIFPPAEACEMEPLEALGSDLKTQESRPHRQAIVSVEGYTFI
jgi:hypothetical protein